MKLPARPYLAWCNGASVAYAGTVVLAYISLLWEGGMHLSHARGVWCLILGVLYAAAGMIDYTSFRLRTTWGARAVYLGLQGGLLFGVLWTSRLHAQIFLCVFPLVAATVALLLPLAATFGVAAIFGLTLGLEIYFDGTGAVVPFSISMLPAFGFVVIFTRLAVREKAARHDAEVLSAEVEKLAVLQERNRLAREIHDSLGHFLTTIHVQLQAARTIHASDPERALDAVAKAQGLARDALVEVRRSVGSLHDARPPAPLTTSLRDLASATDGWGAAVSLEILGEARTLPPEADHALFRAAQEGLTNVRKHAHAQTARVTLDYRNAQRVLIRVTDDGRGVSDERDGRGLAGLRERFGALGGRVIAENPSAGGFCLQGEIPA
jgi:signal transduction histidine kinase